MGTVNSSKGSVVRSH